MFHQLFNPQWEVYDVYIVVVITCKMYSIPLRVSNHCTCTRFCLYCIYLILKATYIFPYNTSKYTNSSSVSPRIHIKGGGVHQWVHDVWSTMFNQCYKTVFFSINFKIKGWRSNTKGWGSAMLPPFRGNTDSSTACIQQSAFTDHQ